MTSDRLPFLALAGTGSGLALTGALAAVLPGVATAGHRRVGSALRTFPGIAMCPKEMEPLLIDAQ